MKTRIASTAPGTVLALALAGCGGGGTGGGGVVSLPEVSFTATAETVAEDGKPVITVELSRAPTEDITLNYTVSGTATDGEDFTALSGTVTVPAGQARVVVPIEITDDTETDPGETLVLTLAAGTGYTLADEDIAFTITIEDNDRRTVSTGSTGSTGGGPSSGSGTTGQEMTDDTGEETEENGEEDISSMNLLLGAMDQEALNKAIDGENGIGGVEKPVIEGEQSICGDVSDCVRIVNKLEERAKKYAPLSRTQLHDEKVGEETFGAAFGRDADFHAWASAVDSYRERLSTAIKGLESGTPPYVPNDMAIATAVRAVSASFSSFVSGRNAIASRWVDQMDQMDDDAWGVWIKEGDATALRYWHREGGDEVTGVGSTFFDKYANDGGNATYTGNLNGYAHYTDSDDATQAGKFGATVELNANFGATASDAASITGTVSSFTGKAGDAGWQDVTLNDDYTATATDGSGSWSADSVYVSGPSATQPDSIAGRVGLTFTGTTNPGGAAGVFEVRK